MRTALWKYSDRIRIGHFFFLLARPLLDSDSSAVLLLDHRQRRTVTAPSSSADVRACDGEHFLAVEACSYCESIEVTIEMAVRYEPLDDAGQVDVIGAALGEEDFVRKEEVRAQVLSPRCSITFAHPPSNGFVSMLLPASFLYTLEVVASRIVLLMRNTLCVV